jgi:hypothetical protein
MPFLHGAFEVVVDLRALGIKGGPVWIRIEWECLQLLTCLKDIS